jgi:hypothetical protein
MAEKIWFRKGNMQERDYLEGIGVDYMIYIFN